MNAVEGFFLNRHTPSAETLLTSMDVFSMMKLLKYGKEYVENAKEQANENKLLGRELIANAIDKDVKTINKNLTHLKVAYQLAMN